MDPLGQQPASSAGSGLPKSKPIYGLDLVAATYAVVGEILARSQAYLILRRLEIEPGPDPVQQVIDLATDLATAVCDLVGEPIP